MKLEFSESQKHSLAHSCLVLTDSDFPYAEYIGDIELPNQNFMCDIALAQMVIYEGRFGCKILKLRHGKIYRSRGYF